MARDTARTVGTALAGVKVIELAHIMAGPVCGLMLGDMGAEVIKVEKIPGGDDTRRSVPPAIEGESAAYMMMNRGKRGISSRSQGARTARRCCIACWRDSDVLIENYRAGTMERLGLGYEDLARASIPPWSTARSRASAAPAPTRSAPGSTSWRRG